MKKYPDAPESKSVPVIYNNIINNKSTNDFPSTINPTNIKSQSGTLQEEEDQGKEYIFNEFTAGAYQEFDVIKINKYNQKQERILGIDRYHIYNDLPKTKEKTSKFVLVYLRFS